MFKKEESIYIQNFAHATESSRLKIILGLPRLVLVLVD